MCDDDISFLLVLWSCGAFYVFFGGDNGGSTREIQEGLFCFVFLWDCFPIKMGLPPALNLRVSTGSMIC